MYYNRFGCSCRGFTHGFGHGCGCHGFSHGCGCHGFGHGCGIINLLLSCFY